MEKVLLPSGVDSLWRFGKPDHVIGRAFRNAVCGETDLSQITEVAFCQALPDFAPGEAARGYERVHVQEVARAYEQTLAALGVRSLEFDFEDDVLNGLDWLHALGRLKSAEDVEALLGPGDASRPRYVLRNALYYHFLLKQFDKVWSVVPSGQRPTLEVSAAMAQQLADSRTGDLTMIYYGAILHQGERDSIRGGNFHSLDQLIRRGGPSLGEFRDRVLSVRSTTPIDLAMPSPTNHRVGPRNSWRGLAAETMAVLLLEDFVPKAVKFLRSGHYPQLYQWEREALTLVRDGEGRGRALEKLQRVLTILG